MRVLRRSEIGEAEGAQLAFDQLVEIAKEGAASKENENEKREKAYKSSGSTKDAEARKTQKRVGPDSKSFEYLALAYRNAGDDVRADKVDKLAKAYI